MRKGAAGSVEEILSSARCVASTFADVVYRKASEKSEVFFYLTTLYSRSAGIARRFFLLSQIRAGARSRREGERHSQRDPPAPIRVRVLLITPQRSSATRPAPSFALKTAPPKICYQFVTFLFPLCSDFPYPGVYNGLRKVILHDFAKENFYWRKKQ